MKKLASFWDPGSVIGRVAAHPLEFGFSIWATRPQEQRDGAEMQTLQGWATRPATLCIVNAILNVRLSFLMNLQLEKRQ
jgi:hypothetical protein